MAALESDREAFFREMKKGYEFRSKLSDITNNLKIYENISMIFLLCTIPQKALEIMDLVLNEQNITKKNNIFYKWLKDELESVACDWKESLAELLTILQNYKLAKMLGYTRNDLMEKFTSKFNIKSNVVSVIRKVLYNLCETLTSSEFNLVVNAIENKQSTGDVYAEYKLLQWSQKNIINLGGEKINLDALIEVLKKLKCCDFIHDIEVAVERTNCSIIRSKSLLKIEPETSDYYKILDETNLGFCIIINQKNFTNDILPKRWGTDKDVDRLSEVFSAFGFNIRLHVDVTYEQLINILGYYAKIVDKNSSFFVLIILSHGSENVIYTSDSLPIDMDTIEMIFQGEVCPNLISKPKIFIIQSCQGEKWQKLVQQPKPNTETDNFDSPIRMQPLLGPQKGDSLIAWSTVQGFASFRDKYNGSWYVQELCNELWKFGDTFDLVEIFTRVNNNLRSKVYGDQFMVPSLLLSLRAKVQLPCLRENFSKGRQLMIERLIFDKYLKEFLIKSGPYLLKFE